MCGILGVLASGIWSGAAAHRALDTLSHRGPDGEGSWSEPLPSGGSIWLGHRRLSIIDLSDSANQPMWDAERVCALTFNGEIYNYLELRAELQALGVTFRTASDSEVLLEAYKVWGDACVSRLNGMYAFAIWDSRSGRLFAARDRYGEKPLLYVSKPGFFAFASEYKALLTLPQVSIEHDELRLLRGAYNPGVGMDGDRQTVFADINQLLPGEAMALEAATLEPRIWRYYDLNPKTPAPGASEAALFDEFRALLTDSVRIRMRSDVPVGSCLSGGLDSSAIVCIARELIGPSAEYHTFTGVFPGTYADERAYAEEVIAAARSTSHLVEPTAERFVAEAGRFMWHNELPVGSASQFAQWCVFDLAKRQNVTVLLDGQGADELLGGYEQYFVDYVRSLRQTGQEERLARERPLIRERYPVALTPPGRALRDRLPFRFKHFLANQLGKGTSFLFGLSPEVAERIQSTAVRPELPGYHALGSTLAQDSFGRFLTTLLRYGDRNSMAHSREVRLPFCDHRLAEFALGLPPQMLMGEVQTKRVLRESLRGVLPEPIRTRWNKQGFRPPQDLWFQSKPFLAMAQDLLASRSFRDSPLWRPQVWDRMLSRVRAGELALGWTLWHPLVIELWRREFLDRVKGSAQQPSLVPAA
jgi:asparagine synthase (glutamine-hydrolysing)